MHYPHTVTFQVPVNTRTPSGQVVHGWENDADLTDLPARIVPVEQDRQTDRYVLDTDRFTIIVQGDREIDREMRAVSDFLGTEAGVVEIQRPVLYRSPQTYATIVTVERLTASLPPAS